MKAIACVVLMIGLLKFAQDAPDLLKRVFGFGGDLLKGMNLNPKGMLKNDMKSAAKTLADPAKAIGHAGAKTLGVAKGGVGAVSGAKAGFAAGKGTDGEGRGFFGGLAGGARGLVAGGKAGYNAQGFKGASTAGQLMGGSAGSSKQIASFGTAQGNMNKGLDIITSRGKADVDKAKDAEKAAKAAYKTNVADYVNNKISDENYVNQFVNASSDRIVNDKVAQVAAANNTTPDVVRNNAQIMDRIRNEAKTEARNQGIVAARDNALKEAEMLYKSQQDDAVSKAQQDMAKAMGKQLENNVGAVKQIVDGFAETQKSWGADIQKDFAESLSKSLEKIKDPVVAQNVKSVFGKSDVKDITMSDIQSVISSAAASGTKDESTLQAIAQVVDKMNSAAKTMNTNLNISSQVLATQVAQASSSGSGDKKDKK